ncbi:MAG TPA: hypothetical protein VFJ85_19100 [Acidimicrobiales bacterium]|nr:hypothetical protein [Acidimicrobiales bacterium]
MDELPPGHPARAVTGRAVALALAVGAAFVALAGAGKELPALYGREPWQDDPYDALVSLALWCGPLLLVLCGPRLALCRRRRPLPVRRAADLVRTAGVLTGLAGVTEAAAWVSVAAGAHRAEWSGTTAAEVGALAALTAATVAAGRALWRAGRALPAAAGAQPDWLADALTLARRESARLGSLGERALVLLGWADRWPAALVRRHPLLAAGAFAAAFGVAVDTPQVVLEGYRPALALLFFAVSACSVFAFLALAGSYLHLVEGRPGAPAPAPAAAVAACACVPLAVAFRDSLWWVVGADGRSAGLAQLAVLAAAAAAAGAVLTGVAVRAATAGRR